MAATRRHRSRAAAFGNHGGGRWLRAAVLVDERPTAARRASAARRRRASPRRRHSATSRSHSWNMRASIVARRGQRPAARRADVDVPAPGEHVDARGRTPARANPVTVDAAVEVAELALEALGLSRGAHAVAQVGVELHRVDAPVPPAAVPASAAAFAPARRAQLGPSEALGDVAAVGRSSAARTWPGAGRGRSPPPVPPPRRRSPCSVSACFGDRPSGAVPALRVALATITAGPRERPRLTFTTSPGRSAGERRLAARRPRRGRAAGRRRARRGTPRCRRAG